MYNIRQWHPGAQPNKRAGSRKGATHPSKINVRTAHKQTRQRQRGRRK